MLAFALDDQENDPLNIRYYHARCASLPFLPDSAFDVVLTNNVIQDLADYQGAFREFGRLLRSGGTYLHIANHPCFMTPVKGWEREEEGRRLHRKSTTTFSGAHFTAPGERNPTWSPPSTGTGPWEIS